MGPWYLFMFCDSKALMYLTLLPISKFINTLQLSSKVT